LDAGKISRFKPNALAKRGRKVREGREKKTRNILQNVELQGGGKKKKKRKGGQHVGKKRRMGGEKKKTYFFCDQ